MIPGHMVAETLFFWVFWVFFMCFCSVLEKACLVCLDFWFGLICFLCWKTAQNQNSKQTKHAILKTCKNTLEKPKKTKKTKSQQPCAQESCYKKLVVELWFLCVWGALLFFGLSLPLSFSTCLLTKRKYTEFVTVAMWTCACDIWVRHMRISCDQLQWILHMTGIACVAKMKKVI